MFRRLAKRIRSFRRFRKDAFYTLNGWRFADLKRYIDESSNVNEDAQLAFVVMRQELSNLEYGSEQSSSGRARLALVTCLPPDDSGIARYSLEHALASQERLDVFSPVRDPSHFMLNAVRLRKNSASGSTLFPLSTILSMNELYEYEHVIFVIGNSDHNIDTYRFMESFVKIYGPNKAICYLHDPCCHNVVQMAKRLSHDQYFTLLQKLYADRLASPDEDLFESWRVHQFAVDRAMLGNRAILDTGIQRFIVNSSAAAEILRDDLREIDRSKVTIRSLYHPVFPLVIQQPEAEEPDGEAGLVIGTYGAPGLSKRTDVVVEAAVELQRRGHKVRLIIAGYQAERFSYQYFGQVRPSWVELSEPHTEQELQLLMSECDIAIQLRDQNLGESSGIVPTLLRMGKLVVVSPIGSFLEYAGATIMFDANSEGLADLIESQPSIAPDRIQAYVDKHDLTHFSGDFVEAVRS